MNHIWNTFGSPVLAGIGACAALAVAIACTDAERSSIGGLGLPHKIVCFSGGREVYTAFSTGKLTESPGGMFSFEDSRSRRYVSVTMDCVVTIPKSAEYYSWINQKGETE